VNDLHVVVYVSSATHLLQEAEIERLLSRARVRNARAGLTGLLLYSDGSFMQYIEGPREALMRTYAVIRRDPLHHDIDELLNEPLTEREFGDWAMAFKREMLPAFLTLPGRSRQTDASRTSQPPLGPGRDLLRSVWAMYRNQQL
jgi:hypothetical protein